MRAGAKVCEETKARQKAHGTMRLAECHGPHLLDAAGLEDGASNANFSAMIGRGVTLCCCSFRGRQYADVDRVPSSSSTHRLSNLVSQHGKCILCSHP